MRDGIRGFFYLVIFRYKAVAGEHLFGKRGKKEYNYTVAPPSVVQGGAGGGFQKDRIEEEPDNTTRP